MAENEIVGLLVGVLFTGQHTSLSSSTWTGACLLTHEKYLVAAVEKQKQIIQENREPVDYKILSEIGTLHSCIREALGLYSPTPLLVRQSHKTFAVKTREGVDYEIPKGHALACSVALSNKLPYIYKNAEVYDPSRFGPGRKEDKAGGKLSDLSFGAGRYSCLGEDYAFMQIKVIWSFLLRNFELKLISPFPEQELERILPGPDAQTVLSGDCSILSCLVKDPSLDVTLPKQNNIL